MKIERLRVRPRKAAVNTPCAAELATMLGCWASSGDIKSAGACAEAAKVLHECMKTSVSLLSGCALRSGIYSLDCDRAGKERIPDLPLITTLQDSQSETELCVSILVLSNLEFRTKRG
ncbi:CHCH domain-containing protein [Rhizoctonia solani AG-1 IA]|uniref:CHCH domain-containing protein n=1 Tax=Thanatephorus cucumeris (strain AG1-IA) TaxID=983506 RepID=L8X3U5_THACA|nr:CHCH domain-containing protein [Rhizoctonia solani AG-1 IA]